VSTIAGLGQEQYAAPKEQARPKMLLPSCVGRSREWSGLDVTTISADSSLRPVIGLPSQATALRRQAGEAVYGAELGPCWRRERAAG
jgi:hypothetical protein